SNDNSNFDTIVTITSVAGGQSLHVPHQTNFTSATGQIEINGRYLQLLCSTVGVGNTLDFYVVVTE
ncbi:MAG: hypothetical protein V3U02_10720, partial [Calditrichia bacterium]